MTQLTILQQASYSAKHERSHLRQIDAIRQAIGHMIQMGALIWMEIGRQKLFDAVGMPVEQIADDGIVNGSYRHRSRCLLTA